MLNYIYRDFTPTSFPGSFTNALPAPSGQVTVTSSNGNEAAQWKEVQGRSVFGLSSVGQKKRSVAGVNHVRRRGKNFKMASQSQGIQQLLTAEKKAAELVSAARKRKDKTLSIYFMSYCTHLR